MDYQTFLETVMKKMEDTLGEEVKIKLNSILKNNSVILEGMTILREGENIAPTIYLNDYYEWYLEGKPLEEIVEELCEVYYKNRVVKSVNAKIFMDFNLIKNKIAYKLVNYKKNQQLLESIPHIKFLDLAIVFYCLLVQEEDTSSSILIYKKHLEMWEISVEEIYDLAMKNTPLLLGAELKEIEEVLEQAFLEEMKHHFDEFLSVSGEEELTGEEKEEKIKEVVELWKQEKAAIPMYVLTNESKINGAACILYKDILYNFAQKFENDLYILPSSVHEVILVPASVVHTIEDLESIVKEANETQVAKEEVLSDKIYTYSFQNQTIFLA